MTAEIAVLNKDAVALAADSTVTVSGRKAYHTTNKLFALSSFHPVGVMIYGSGELAGVPWETLIKIFRQKLGNQRFDRLVDYQSHFINFLEKDIKEYNPDDELEIILEYAENYFEALVDELDTTVKSRISIAGTLSRSGVSGLLRKIVEDHSQKWSSEPLLECMDQRYANKLLRKYRDKIAETAKEKLEDHKVSKLLLDKICLIAAKVFCSKLQESSGIVFSGFGDKELFPGLSACGVECIASGKLKFSKSNIQIDNRKRTAAIIPFAQTDIVATFMGGMSDKIRSNVFRGLDTALTKYASSFLDRLKAKGVNGKILDSTLIEASSDRERINREFRQIVNDLQRKFHIGPVIDAVEFLPKREMAEVAEALVSITSFRQKISLEQESVGGAIDVAVISKCDGFVWIKRKHYFEAELNPMFFSKYLNERS